MPIRVKCPNAACGKVLTVADEAAGKRGKCPACGTGILIPGGVKAAAAPAARPPAKAPTGAVAKGRAPAPIKKAPPPPEDEPEPVDDEVDEADEPRSVRKKGGMPVDDIIQYAGLGCFALALIVTFLPWMSIFGISASLWDNPAWDRFAWLGFSLAGAALLGAGVALKNLKPLAFAVASASGTFLALEALSLFLALSKVAGFGMYLGILVGFGSAGTSIYLAMRHPMGSPRAGFFKKHLVFVIAVGIIGLFGLLMVIVRATSESPFGGGGGGSGPGKGGKQMEIPKDAMKDMFK